MLYICIFSNKFDLIEAIRVSLLGKYPTCVKNLWSNILIKSFLSMSRVSVNFLKKLGPYSQYFFLLNL